MSNTTYWRAKIAANRQRDTRNEEALRAKGWRVFVVWACEIRRASGRDETIAALARRIREEV